MKDFVRGVEFVAGEVHLCSEFVKAKFVYFEMNVRRAHPIGVGGVSAGQYGFETIMPLSVGHTFSPILKIWVKRGRVGVVGMVIATAGAGLPDFNQGIGKGSAVLVGYLADDKNQFTESFLSVAVDLCEIVVFIGLIFDRIKRPFGLRRSQSAHGLKSLGDG